MTKRTKGFTLVELTFDRLRIIRKCKSAAFTLVELLVVVAIIALLVSILLPTLDRAREKVKQVVCMSNLSGISKGWAFYRSANNALPPILPDINQKTMDNYAEALRMGDECTEAALGQGAQQNLCLLVKIGAVPWGMFICPSSGNAEAVRDTADKKYGLGDGIDKSYCDYGLQIPYDWALGYDNICPLTQHMDGGIVILGDQGPRPLGTNNRVRDAWSRNHPDDGESLLYVAGNVRFSKDRGTLNGVTSLNTGGWGGNNIYAQDYWTGHYTENPTLTDYGWAIRYSFSTKDTVLYSWPRD